MNVALYGSLIVSGDQNEKIKDQEYLGEFNSEPLYNMYEVNSEEPGLTLDGRTSVRMEVYKISKQDTTKIIEPLFDNIKDSKNKNKLFTKKIIDTPFGKALTYLYKGESKKLKQIINGDWYEHKTITSIENYM